MPLMDAVLDLSMSTVFVDAHGTYPRKIVSVKVPPGMTIIETALPTQDTFSSIFNHLHALLVDPAPLVYLFHPDMKINTPNKGSTDDEVGKTVSLQQAILMGDYDTVVALVGPILGEDPKLLHKLEELESVVQSLTVYTAGDIIFSRELSFFDADELDDTCSVSTSGLALREDGFKAAIKTNAGTTSAAIIAELRSLAPVKLIIMSCGHIKLKGFDLANAIMPIRQRFWNERDSTAGPPSTHTLSQGAYSTHEWCHDGTLLKKYIKDVSTAAQGRSTATETQETYTADNDDSICSSNYTTRLNQFIYVNTGGPSLGDGKGDEYTIDVNSPFIVTTLDKLLLEYTAIIQNLYLIDKSTMNLIKVTDILAGFDIDLAPENAELIKLYMDSFAKYILNKYHMPADRKEEQAIPSFRVFKEELGSKINEAISTWKFSNKMEVLPVMSSLGNFKSFRNLPIVSILRENAATLTTKDNDEVQALIEIYREYLGEDMKYWVKTKLGLTFESHIDHSSDPDILVIQNQMKVASDAWRSRMFASRGPVQIPEGNYAAPNPSGKRKASGGFRITRKKSRKGRKSRARRRGSRSRK